MGGLTSVMNNSVGLILVAAVFGVGGQLSLKVGMSQVGRLGEEIFVEPAQVGVRVLTTPLVVLGLVLYVLGAAVWLAVLSRASLSFAYPILAVSYAVTPLLAWLVLGEQLTPLRWVGIGVICLGVYVVSRS